MSNFSVNTLPADGLAPSGAEPSVWTCSYDKSPSRIITGPAFEGLISDTHNRFWFETLHWRHNGRDGVSNHQPRDCLLNRLTRCRSKKTSKLCVTGLCAGNSPVTGEFPAQRASNAENVSLWWRHDTGSQETYGRHFWRSFWLLCFRSHLSV